MRAPQRAPSQCNISERTLFLFLFLFIVFLSQTSNLLKKQKLSRKGDTEDHRIRDGWTLAALWLILLLHCVFSCYRGTEIKTTGEIWHYLHGIFALFIDFFSLHYKKKWRKTKEQRLFILTTLVKYHTTWTDQRQKNVMLEATSDYIFIFWKEKKTTINKFAGKKRTKPRKCKPKKGLISVTICMQSIWNQPLISTNLCFWQMLSVHSKGSLHMNVDGVRAKMLGLKYQSVLPLSLWVLGDFWQQNGGLKRSPLGYCFVCTVFDFLMGPFLNVIFAGLTLCVLCLLNWIWIQCMCLSKMLLHAM